MVTKTKKDIVNHVAKEQGLTISDVSRVFTAAMEYIYNEVASGNRVTLAGFGRFEKRHHEARRCTLPGYENNVTAPYDVVAFKASAHI